MRLCLLFTMTAMLASAVLPAEAQWQVGPVYPRHAGNPYRTTPPNYNPFRLNWSSGRFNYVPIPYEPEPNSANYSPYRFNWHSGRWDYVPFPDKPYSPAQGSYYTSDGDHAEWYAR